MVPVATDNISGNSIPPSIAAQTSLIDHNVEEMPKVVVPKPKILRFTGRPQLCEGIPKTSLNDFRSDK